MTSFKDNVFGALSLYNAGSLQDIIKIPLGLAVLLARGRSLGGELDGVHLRPLHLDRAKAIRAPSIQTNRLMASSRGQALTSHFTSPK